MKNGGGNEVGIRIDGKQKFTNYRKFYRWRCMEQIASGYCTKEVGYY